jgi:isochorismate pyruvate lyase
MESNLNQVVACNSLEQVRENIDRLDRQIVGLLAERGSYVTQAARFKKTTNDVKAPQRVEQVITKVVALSSEMGANPAVTEAVYRAMISAFINAELAEHAALAGSGDRV